MTAEIFFLLPLSVCMILLLACFLKGPGTLDRLVTFESLSIISICLFAYLGWIYQSEWFFDALLVLSLIGFLSTVAVALNLVYTEEQ